MARGKRIRTVGLVVVAGLIGYLIGPPIVEAATNLVVIKDSSTSRKARVVTGGALRVQPYGGRTDVSKSTVFNIALGTDRFAEGTVAELACDSYGWLSGVVLNGPSSGSYGVTLFGDDADEDQTPNDIIWSGTVQADGHISDSFFDGGVFWDTSLSVSYTGVGGRWILYGLCTGNPSLRPQKAREAFGGLGS